MPANTLREGRFGNVKRGWYDINGRRMFFRSKWEANYALYLDLLLKQKVIVAWEYEAESFVFEAIQFGTRSYRPDFKVTKPDGTVEFHEVKGWMDSKSATKLKRMKKYYPNVVLHLIDTDCYRDIARKVGPMLGFY